MTEVNYELEHNNQWAEVEKAFDAAFEKLDEFSKEWYDWNFPVPNKNEIIKKLLLQYDFKLNVYSYSDRYYDRCGGSGGEESHLVTPLSENEIRQQMRVYYEKDPNNFCCHRFLRSLSDNGIYFDDATSCYGYAIGDEVDFSNIKEKDILSPERYAEIVAAREAAEKAKREKEQKEREEKDKEARRKQFELLKKEFE